MDYSGALSYLRGFERLGYRFRLENTRDLLDSLGFGFDGEIVHIAGTNGKGSCACVLDSILRMSGRKVGFYTSPELIDFTERVRVDGVQIDRERFAELAGRLKPHIDSMGSKPTFFEATTALALKHFADERVDVIILEVGMGGRLDSTNAVESKLQVITNVEIDHTSYLGSTVGEIAVEKAGIIHGGSVVVTAASGEALDIISSAAAERGSRVVKVGGDVVLCDVESSLDGVSFKMKTGRESYVLRSPMRGGFQALNIACAVSAAEELGTTRGDILSAVPKAYWPGRLDLVRENPRVIVDSAHNAAGMRESLAFIRSLDYDRLVVVAGFMSDKEYKPMIGLLSEADVLIATRADLKRALGACEILKHADGVPVERVSDAVDHALSIASEDDLVLITGSIYVAGEAIRKWRDRIDL
ncbi:MAG: bifunctional folylpolyglutamate synthase/dihydrofolate synthase [Candidatus Altiarchaeales archaeon]|nr:bifunctional folylpolyglutamate synthase/dihydrofolate synthase [Candidatus Altiarchaeales archaeon]MBD3416730.1 bifunctional folylpolyglutamate synthase/dihydrofolate synthase [Candidatus Altiarchaeales archaeon]